MNRHIPFVYIINIHFPQKFYIIFFYKKAAFFRKIIRIKMVNILDIVRSNEQAQINVNKLRELCSRTNVWDYFGLGKEDFLNLSVSKQSQLTSKFYFENVNKPQQESIDASIGSIINSSSSINLKKVYENGENRTEMSLSTTKDKKKKIRDHVDQKWFFCR